MEQGPGHHLLTLRLWQLPSYLPALVMGHKDRPSFLLGWLSGECQVLIVATGRVGAPYLGVARMYE